MPVQAVCFYSTSNFVVKQDYVLTCRWTPEQACDIAPVQSDKTLLRGQESTACLDHVGVQPQNGHLQEDLSLLELPYRALI